MQTGFNINQTSGSVLSKLNYWLIVAGLLVINGFSSGISAQQASPALFSRAEPNQDVRASLKSKGTAQLLSIKGDTLLHLQSKSVQLPLINEELEAIGTDFETRSQTNFTWRGKFPQDGGDITLTWVDGYCAGVIQSPTSLYTIVPTEVPNISILKKLDPQAAPTCGGTQTVEVPPLISETARPTGVSTPSVSTLDIMIVYTTQARVAAGGTAQMLAQAQNAVDTANTAYINSQVNARLRLVQTMEVNYAETPDFFQMLEWVRTDPTVAARRNACQADLVSMLVNNTSLGGRGYLMQSGNIGPAFEAYAFSVVCWYYASSYYVLAHEVGHNLGCHHDVANATEQGAYPFSYGQYYSGIYRTVMAYDNGCQCPMYAGFSNPNRTFQNLPTGIANQTDNAQTINQTAPIAATFRGPGVVIPLLTLAAPNGGETLTAGTAAQIVWTTTTDYPETAVRLELMRNGTLQQVISASTSTGSNGIGTFSWTIPTNVTPGNDYQIRVSHPSNSAVQDTSDSAFSITGPNTATLTVTTPNGGESWALNTRQTVRWTYTENPGSAVQVELFKNGIFRQVIAAAAPIGSNGSGSFDWDISSAELPGSDYTVKITSTSFSTISDVSNSTFSLGSVPVNATIQVVTPNGGEKWKPRTQQQIRWSFTGNPGAKVKVELYKGGVFKQVISAGAAIGTNGAGSLNWLVPSTLVAGSDYKIKITSTTIASATDFSNQNFSIFR